MADEAQTPRQSGERPVNLGVFARQIRPSGLSAAEVAALGLTVVWLLGVTIFFFVAGRSAEAVSADPLRVVMLIVAIFMPIALIWVAALAVNSARIMREESARLQTTIDAMRQSYLSQQQSRVSGITPAVERKIERILSAQDAVMAGVAGPAASFTSVRPEPTANAPKPRLAAPGEQTSFPLAEPGLPDVTASIADFISALNFPETAEDREGFRALRRAMQDRRAAELIQASQDVLTLLSQDGIYMDDLTPDRARPEIWRRFAEGQRGRPIATLGGIRDRSSLALSAARMRQDPIFRDAVHHFLRKFDQIFSSFAETATDQEIAAVSDTRTARAFMLLGRVTGVFT